MNKRDASCLLHATLLLSAGFVLAGAFPNTARAEFVIVDLKAGGQLGGTLVELVPGDHVTIDTGGGHATRIPKADIGWVQRNVPEPQHWPRATPAPELQLSAASQAAVIQALMTERADWQSRDTGLAGPLACTLVGVVALAVGVGLQVAYGASEYNDGTEYDPVYKKTEMLNTASIATLIGGGVVLGTGVVLWLLRTSTSHQERELQRIDQQLGQYGVQASLAPWVAPRTSGLAGASGGLRFSLQF